MEKKGLFGKFTSYYDDNKIIFPSDWNIYPLRFEARIGLIQLEKIHKILKERKRRSIKIMEKFSNHEGINFFSDTDEALYSHLIAIVDDRKKWENIFIKNNIQIGTLIDYSLPEIPLFKKYTSKQFPNSKYYSKHIINIPNYPIKK